MKVSKFVGCQDFPCDDVRHECYIIPNIDLKPEDISAALSIAKSAEAY
jgi:hypothetical protein